MFAPNRRKERNPGVIDLLTNTHHFKANKIEDFSDFVAQNKFLEVTVYNVPPAHLDRVRKYMVRMTIKKNKVVNARVVQRDTIKKKKVKQFVKKKGLVRSLIKHVIPIRIQYL